MVKVSGAGNLRMSLYESEYSRKAAKQNEFMFVLIMIYSNCQTPPRSSVYCVHGQCR